MTYTPRLTAPTSSDLRWIQVNSGGYNQCIYGSDGPPSVLPNCTGYVHGRWMEIGNLATDNMGLSFADAKQYYSQSDASLVRNSEPRLGAVVCYDSTSASNPHGHVSIVEEIIDSNTIRVSQSDYGISYFGTYTLYRQYGWLSSQYDTGLVFQGFIECPYVEPEPPTPVGGNGMSLIKKWWCVNNLRGNIVIGGRRR